MNSYFFILGRNPALSFSEIISVLKKNSVPFTIKSLSREALIISTENTLSVGEYVNILGGTVKAGEVFSEINKEKEGINWEKNLTPELLLKSCVSGKVGKVHFGTSIYNQTTEDKYVAQYNREQGRVNIQIKKILKQNQISSGFVQSKERILPTATILYNKLLSNGFEFSVFVSECKVLIGKTLSIQDFNAFSFRDMNRPFRDKKSGIIPPKLARIMINLSGKDSQSTILDPFCGSGTIPLEANLLGFRNILASDNSQKAVSDTQANLEWAKIHVFGFKGEYMLQVLKADVETLMSTYKPGSIDVIVTEPYLGPTIFNKPTKESVETLFKELSSLYQRALLGFSKILKPGGVVVMVF